MVSGPDGFSGHDDDFDWDQMFEDYGVCPHLREGLRRYFEHHIRPGDFLCAVLGNDLKDSVCRADGHETLRGIPDLVRLLIDQAPASSWGSKTNIKEWCARKDRPPMPDDYGKYRR